MAKVTIQKIKNFEGYYFTCQKCGRQIMHGFMVNEEGCYGSECVYGVAGFSGGQQVKKLMSRQRLVNKYRKSTQEMARFTPYAEAYNCEVEDIIHGFIQTGDYKPVS